MKTFIKVLIVLGILAVLFMLGVNYFISSMFEREAIVLAVEENIDTRFDVQDVDVNIFSTAPSIKLEDVKFAPKDQYVDDKIRVEDRPEITSETVYLRNLELNIDIVHLIKTEKEIISEITIGEGSSVSSSGILEGLKSSLSGFSDAGFDIDILSDKLTLDADLEIKTLFVDGKISFLKDLNLKALDYDLSLTKESWFNIEDNSHQFQGMFLLSEDRSKEIFKDIDNIIDEETSPAIDNGYTVDKNEIKDKLLEGMVKDDRIYVKFTSTGNINDPEFTLSSSPESLEKIVEGAVKEAIK